MIVLNIYKLIILISSNKTNSRVELGDDVPNNHKPYNRNLKLIKEGLKDWLTLSQVYYFIPR